MIVPGYTHHPGWGAFGPQEYSTRQHAVYSIYLIEGPSGVYVGCTAEPAKRWRAHLSAASCPPNESNIVVTMAMRVDGATSYTFRIFAQAIGHWAGTDTEVLVIRQLRRQGLRVLNVQPRERGHKRPRKGRFVGVVVNGRVEPLFPAAVQHGGA